MHNQKHRSKPRLATCRRPALSKETIDDPETLKINLNAISSIRLPFCVNNKIIELPLHKTQ